MPMPASTIETAAIRFFGEGEKKKKKKKSNGNHFPLKSDLDRTNRKEKKGKRKGPADILERSLEETPTWEEGREKGKRGGKAGTHAAQSP